MKNRFTANTRHPGSRYLSLIHICEHALYFGHPEEISDYYMEDMRHLEQEEIRVMFLNTKQAMIRDQIMARGTVNASVMTPREVLDVYKRQERS